MAERVVTIHQAKTHLSRLIQAALRGEEIVIANRDKPVARLVPIRASADKRRLGTARGQVRMSDDFDAPLEDFAPYEAK